MVTTVDSSFVLASDAAPADDAARATWGRAARCAVLASTASLLVMLLSAAAAGARPGVGNVLIVVLVMGLLLTGFVLRGRPGGDAAVRVAAALGFMTGAVGILGAITASGTALPPAVTASGVVGAALLWRLRRPVAWRLSDTFLSLGGAFALTALVAWNDPLNGLVRVGTEYPAMRPLTAWVALAIGAALWSSHHRFRRLGWLLLAAAAVPLALTFAGRFGFPTPSAWLWARGVLPARDAPLVGNHSDVVLACAMFAVALRLRDPRREQGWPRRCREDSVSRSHPSAAWP